MSQAQYIHTRRNLPGKRLCDETLLLQRMKFEFRDAFWIITQSGLFSRRLDFLRRDN